MLSLGSRLESSITFQDLRFTSLPSGIPTRVHQHLAGLTLHQLTKWDPDQSPSAPCDLCFTSVAIITFQDLCFTSLSSGNTGNLKAQRCMSWKAIMDSGWDPRKGIYLFLGLTVRWLWAMIISPQII